MTDDGNRSCLTLDWGMAKEDVYIKLHCNIIHVNDSGMLGAKPCEQV